MSTHKGRYDARGRKVGLVVSRFNEFITKRILDAAVDELRRSGAAESDFQIVWVPGAFEVPLASRKLAETKSVEAVIAIACVLKGETPHFELVSAELVRGVMEVSLATDIPVVLGAVVADTLEQAIQRAGGKFGNKGQEAARTALEMINLYRELGRAHPDVQARLKVANAHA